jgi:hypothetical protein
MAERMTILKLNLEEEAVLATFLTSACNLYGERDEKYTGLNALIDFAGIDDLRNISNALNAL